MSAPGRKIMIAMDGSKHSEYAFDWYIKYFYKEKDDVLLVYCAESNGIALPSTASADATAALKTVDDGEVANLVSQLQKKLQGAGVKGNVLRLAGSKPGEAIVKASEENKVDMIITGTRGLGTIKRTLMGSVSLYVVHHAQIPVLVVRK